MAKVKKALYFAFALFFGGFAAYYYPAALIVAFNFTHGIANNPDGDIVRPLGVLFAFFLIVVAFFFCRQVIQTETLKKTGKWVCFSVLCFTAIVGTVLSLYAWKEFFYCISWHITH